MNKGKNRAKNKRQTNISSIPKDSAVSRDLEQKVMQLPEKPGVYMMEDSLGKIIYVGKAKNLKRRVSQYFTNEKNRAPKVVNMVNNIHTFNYIVTDTELDALIEECRLIKEIKPRYNSLMKDDKNYVYIKISGEKYPQLSIADEKTEKKINKTQNEKINKEIDEEIGQKTTDNDSIYFGPFTSFHKVEKAVEYLNDYFLLRKCTRIDQKAMSSGCMFRQLGKCLGPCTGTVSTDEYMERVGKLQEFLKGNDITAMQELKKKIDTAIEQLKFEKAALYREYYLSLRHVFKRQQLVQQSNRNINILAIEIINTSLAKIFFIKGNRLINRVLINIEKASKLYGFKNEDEEINSEFKLYLKKLYFKRDILENLENEEAKNKEDDKKELGKEEVDIYRLSQYDIDEAQIIYSYLKKNSETNGRFVYWAFS